MEDISMRMFRLSLLALAAIAVIAIAVPTFVIAQPSVLPLASSTVGQVEEAGYRYRYRYGNRPYYRRYGYGYGYRPYYRRYYGYGYGYRPYYYRPYWRPGISLWFGF